MWYRSSNIVFPVIASHCKSSQTDKNCSLIVHKILTLHKMTHLIPELAQQPSLTQNVLTSPVWGAAALSWLLNTTAAVTPCAVLGVPRSCIPTRSWCPALHPYHVTHHADRHSLVQMVLPVPSLPPNTLKPLNHPLNCFLPQGHFTPHHSPPKATSNPDFFPCNLSGAGTGGTRYCLLSHH